MHKFHASPLQLTFQASNARCVHRNSMISDRQPLLLPDTQARALGDGSALDIVVLSATGHAKRPAGGSGSGTKEGVRDRGSDLKTALVGAVKVYVKV